MVNTEEFVKRLEKLLRYYGLSASGFADKIEVQRSSISHLLSGRNKPSLDLVLKVVKTFPEVNLYWLLNGKGSFPSDADTTTPLPTRTVAQKKMPTPPVADAGKSIEKVIIFYTDGSFKSFDGK
tara:strand:+ start:261 stop:632 length:372 start_codon:yes stop_codon:yes gene_type:complete